MPRTRPGIRASLVAVAAIALLPIAAGAETYTLTLQNGNTFESRHAPQEASWDSAKVLVLTDGGNWVALDRADIRDVSTSTELKGFGTVIDTTTILLGVAPNDGRRPRNEALADTQQRADVNDFAEPDSTGGIPASILGLGTGSGYGTGTGAASPAPAPPPTPAPAPAPTPDTGDTGAEPPSE